MQRIFCLALTLLVTGVPARAQDAPRQQPPTTPPDSREAVIAAERAEKQAQLWPERQDAFVDLVNGLAERGLKEGLDSGKGANGLQLTLGGMRPAQGMTYGIGYRRSDLLRDHLGYRATVRGTIGGAYMLDFDVDFRDLHTERTYLRWYTKYEHSPAIDYFGQGNHTAESARASYRFDDVSSDFAAAFTPVRYVRLGATGGVYSAHTAPSGEEGLPPIDQAFPVEDLLGFHEDTTYTRIGLFAFFDSRDSLTGPRAGGIYGARYREYWDVERKEFAFRQTEFEAQHYFPYLGRDRVLALRAAVVLSFPKAGNVVPIYLQPMLGGSDDLRGFVPYRFRDYHSLSLGVEHRWHAFSVLDMALFADAGKVVQHKDDLTPNQLHYSGGLGFRVRLRSAIVTRVDIAGSNEGLRFICTFSDIFAIKF